jgi:hypothetical protein
MNKGFWNMGLLKTSQVCGSQTRNVAGEGALKAAMQEEFERAKAERQTEILQLKAQLLAEKEGSSRLREQVQEGREVTAAAQKSLAESRVRKSNSPWHWWIIACFCGE